jgi:hypothetical protein
MPTALGNAKKRLWRIIYRQAAKEITELHE